MFFLLYLSMFYLSSVCQGPGWLNDLGHWITQQLIQAYQQ